MGANAQTKVPTFAAAEVLTAANQNLLSNGIPVFSGTATRDDAFGGSGEKTLAEGQFAFLEDSNATQYYDGAAWQSISASKFGQIVNVSKVDTFTTSSGSFVDVTGMSATITPTSASSTVLVILSCKWSNNNSFSSVGQLLRGATSVGGGTAVGNRASSVLGATTSAIGADSSVTIFIDTPATTSATTYKLQALSAGGTFYLNRGSNDDDVLQRPRSASTLTLIEILP
jgi:hypothetical protein